MTPAPASAAMPSGWTCDEVIGRTRADGRSDLRPAARAKFVGVDPRLEARLSASLEDRGRLRRGEEARVAEHVAPLGELRRARDDLRDQVLHVVVLPAAILGRHLVRAHERGRELDRLPEGERRNHPQHPQFRIRVEPVPRLGLARRRARRQHAGQAARGRRHQLVLGRGPRGPNRGEDAAALGRDLRVRRAGQPPAQLVAPIAGEDDVGVAVDEAGNERAAATVDDARRGRDTDPGPDLRRGSDRHDGLAFTRDGAVGNQAGVALPRACSRRRTGDGVDLVEVFNEEHGEF